MRNMKKKIVTVAMVVSMILCMTAYATDVSETSAPNVEQISIYGSYTKDDTGFTDADIKYDKEAEHDYLYIYTTYRNSNMLFFAGPFEYLFGNVYMSYSNDGVLLITFDDGGTMIIDTSSYAGEDIDKISGVFFPIA